MNNQIENFPEEKRVKLSELKTKEEILDVFTIPSDEPTFLGMVEIYFE